MREIKRYYLKMLRVEIEDLHEDINLLIEEYNRLHEKEQLSSYVFSESLIVFRKELLGVDAFFRLLETDPVRGYAQNAPSCAHSKARTPLSTCSRGIDVLSNTGYDNSAGL
jgi:hypothetical protein